MTVARGSQAPHNFALKLSGGPRSLGRSLAPLRVAPIAASIGSFISSGRPARSLTLIRYADRRDFTSTWSL
jgi:hypothetical protein